MEIKDTIILTRKVQLLIDCEEEEKRRFYYRRIFNWVDKVYKGANLVLSHQYLLAQLREIPYLNEPTKIRIADVAKDTAGVLCTSKMNTTYRVLSGYFKGEIPAAILSPLNQMMVKLYQSESLAYSRGERTLRCFRKVMPIPVAGNQLKVANTKVGKEFKISLLQIPFRTYLGKDRNDKRMLLQQVQAGLLKVCNCALQFTNGKLFLLLTLEVPKKTFALKPYVIAETSLGIEHPLSVSIGSAHLQIGSKEEFLYRRLAIQAAMQRVQKAVAFNVGGQGKKRKFKPLERFKNKERNYVDSKLHLYSRILIDFCIKHSAGTLLLVDQSAKIEVAHEDAFVLRNWNYYGLIEKIKYKATMAGITVVME